MISCTCRRFGTRAGGETALDAMQTRVREELGELHAAQMRAISIWRETDTADMNAVIGALAETRTRPPFPNVDFAIEEERARGRRASSEIDTLMDQTYDRQAEERVSVRALLRGADLPP